MKCPGCDRELRRDERAQPATVMGHRMAVPSFCDECCRANPWQPGNSEALERLVDGRTDEAEMARVRNATPTPYDS